MRGIVEPPPIITGDTDIELMVNNFYRCLKRPYPESVLAFAPLIFIDPHQLPADVLEYFPEHFNYLAEILESRSKDGLMLNQILQDKYLPVKATPEEVLYWMGSVRITHGVYSNTLTEILLGFAHHIRSLIDAGDYREADAIIEHVYRLQERTDTWPVDIEALVTLLEGKKAADQRDWEGGLAEDIMEYATDSDDTRTAAAAEPDAAPLKGSTTTEQHTAPPSQQPQQQAAPSHTATTGVNIAKYFGDALVNNRLALTPLGVTASDFIQDFDGMSATDVSELIPLIIKVAQNELRLNRPASIRFLGDIDSGMNKRLFRSDNKEQYSDYDTALAGWYALLSTAPVGIYELLSDRTAYFALQQFATLEFDPRRDKLDALRRFDLLRTYAARMEDYTTSLDAANKKIRWAQLSRDNVAALAAAEDAYRYSRELLKQGYTEVIAQALWSTRSFSQLSSWFKNKVQAADLLLSIPKEFPFNQLDTKSQVNYILSRIELAGLCQEAGQERSRITLLNEAADLYDSIGYFNDALKLRAQHKL